MPKSDQREPLYSEVEAARRLGIDLESLRTKRLAGRIRHMKIARKIMYLHADLVAGGRQSAQ